MPLDPRIPLAGISTTHPAPLQMPLDIQQQRAQVQNLQADAAMRQQQQEGMQLENEIRRRDLEEQKVIQEAYRQIATGDGDYSKLPKLIQGKVQPTTFQKIQQGVVQHQRNMAALTKEQLDNAKTHAGMVGSYGQRIMMLPPEQRAEAWTRIRPELINSGLGTETDFPEQYPGDAWTQDHVAAALDSDKQVDLEYKRREEERKVAQAKRDAELHPMKVAEQAAKTADAIKEQAGSQLRNAPDQASYASAWYAIKDPAIRNQFPHPDKWDAKTTPDVVTRAALTASQASTAATTEQARAETARHNRVMEAYDAQSLALRRQAEGRQNTADQRQAYTEVAKLEAEERKLNQEARRLANALRSGTFVAPNGQLQSIPAKLAGESDEQAAARKQGVLDDMKARYAAAADSLKGVIRQKYDQYGRLNVAPNIPLPQIEAEIDAGAESVLNPQAKQQKPAAPAPQQQTTTQPAQQPKPAQTKPQQQQTPNPDEVISVKLPNGKFLTGPRGKVSQALSEAGYSLND